MISLWSFPDVKIDIDSSRIVAALTSSQVMLESFLASQMNSNLVLLFGPWERADPLVQDEKFRFDSEQGSGGSANIRKSQCMPEVISIEYFVLVQRNPTSRSRWTMPSAVKLDANRNQFGY